MEGFEPPTSWVMSPARYRCATSHCFAPCTDSNLQPPNYENGALPVGATGAFWTRQDSVAPGHPWPALTSAHPVQSCVDATMGLENALLPHLSHPLSQAAVRCILKPSHSLSFTETPKGFASLSRCFNRSASPTPPFWGTPANVFRGVFPLHYVPVFALAGIRTLMAWLEARNVIRYITNANSSDPGSNRVLWFFRPAQ